MVAATSIAATSYATPSAQAWAGRARLNQARQEADQAEARARQLRTQADQAEQQAQQGQNTVRTLSAQVAQQDSTYSAQLRKQASSEQTRQVQSLLNPVTAVTGTSAPLPNDAPSLPFQPWSTANQRATSGRLLNVSA